LATTAGGLSESPFGMPAPIGRALHKIAPSVVEAALAQGDLIEFGRRYGNDLGLWLTKKYSFGSNVSPALTNFTSEMINATPIEVIAEFLPGLEAHEKAEALAAMTGVEALVMVGDKDLLTPPSHSAEIIRRMPQAEFELLADTGHMLMLERFPEVNYALRELISRVRASLRRAYGELSAPGGAEELRFADVVVNFSKMSVTRAGKAINLTPTEFRLLRHLLINPGIPFSRDALVQEVWGYDDDVFDDRTVDVHMRHLREKLEDIPAEPRYLITVRGVGYKFEL